MVFLFFAVFGGEQTNRESRTLVTALWGGSNNIHPPTQATLNELIKQGLRLSALPTVPPDIHPL